ncbi:mitochondrial substrate carrier [Volvox carteri f. nagariensis]|uniref:Mitochondrial substrate carrier n=1 Tax=Volvox carteri f. nagariensis TaxID=3068 RepID=D8TI21_VOLCA|nr:mitochondrial substrate carrier [Volvox carteri f. nagariensis]EFJ52815.1 mitochondrial substrate carrier [Volvox carteri f. nagariensis]|eukprot:XP_002945820.1 mitochondrial substrate carrier [Volvox carteri f. nagariensis]
MAENKKFGQPSVSPALKGFAGSIGGVAEACCLQPMDVIKTRLQLDKVGKYKGIIDCGRQIYTEEGIGALWKGLTPFATHLTLKYALRMGSNSVYQGLLRDENGKLTDGRRMLAGFMAGITEALVIVTPFEVVKIRLQQQKGLAKEHFKYKGPIHCATTVLREEGIRGMWSGATPTILRNGTNQMCLFWAKNNADALLWGKHEGDGKILTPVQSMTSGFLAALLGPVATGPFDVAKTRLMAQTKTSEGVRYKGFFDALVRIPAEEGVMAMWKGLLPRLLRIPPGQAIVWAVSDQITGYFERQALLQSGRLTA